MELTLASLVNEALSDCGRGLRQLQKLPLRMRLRRKELPVQRRRQRTLTNEPAERVEARAGTPCEFPLRSGAARLTKMLKQFIADESGATAIKYGSIAADIAIAIVPALNGVGSSLKVKFTTISTSLK
jgi:pilus assembly protein Flp/PilA